METQIVQEQQGPDGIQSIADLVQEIGDAIRTQSSSLGQLNQAAQQLGTMIQQQAPLFEKATVTVEKLVHQAEERQRIMVFFKIGEAAGEMRVDVIQRPFAEKPPVVTENKNAQQDEPGSSKSKPSDLNGQCHVSGDVLTIGARAIQEDFWEEDVEWF
jgi:hypothetical protein